MFDIKISPSLGNGVFGLYHKPTDQIFIAKNTIERGFNFTCSTVYEEWVHKTMGLDDESRGMQDHLLDKLMHFAIKLHQTND